MGRTSRADSRAYIFNFNLIALACFCSSFVDTAIIRDGQLDLFRLSFIHYNDFHARFEETSQTFPVCSSNDTNCLGGYSRLYQEIQTLLQERPDSIVLNAGDVFQGTYWYTLMKWDITQKFINLLPNDVHTIGNHEFDDGVAGLAPYLAALRAPVIVANIDTTDEPSMNGLYKPHIILQRKGRKIGIIGLITDATALTSNPDKVKFLDPIAVVRKEAKQLTAKGVDIIIVLSHCGLATDKKMANEVGEDIDVIIGGHTHDLLWNGVDPPEASSGTYPVIETAKSNGHKVVIVTASAYSKFLGNLSVYFDDSGEVRRVEGDPIYLNRSIPEDPKITELLSPYMEKLHAMVNEVIGYTPEGMDEQLCSSGECVLGDFIADAIMNKTKQKITTKLPHISMILRNMIRGSIPRGNITRGALINTLPYTNKIVSFPITGKDLLACFVTSLQTTWKDQPFSGPFLPQVSGLRVTLNTTSKSVVSAFVLEDDSWSPVKPDKKYQLTVAKFLTKGGNGFQMFKKYSDLTQLVGVDFEIFEEYLKLKPAIPKLEHRLVMVE